jgi:hypothetical protein
MSLGQKFRDVLEVLNSVTERLEVAMLRFISHTPVTAWRSISNEHNGIQ